MLEVILIINCFLGFWATVLVFVTLRNVYKIEYNIRKDELSYIWKDDRFLYRIMLRSKIWCLLGLNLSSISKTAGLLHLVVPFQSLYLALTSLLGYLFLFLLSLIFYLIYKKKDLDFLKITKVGA